MSQGWLSGAWGHSQLLANLPFQHIGRTPCAQSLGKAPCSSPPYKCWFRSYFLSSPPAPGSSLGWLDRLGWGCLSCENRPCCFTGGQVTALSKG